MYRVIFEDEYLIGIDKTVVIPCLRNGDSAGLSDELVLEFPELHLIPDYGFTHRLDNETLGIILIAKTREYHESIRLLFSEKQIQKTYHARVSGSLIEAKGVIEDPIAHSKKTDKKMIVVKDGYRIFRGQPRPAYTEWNILRKTEITTDLELKISTGVRHQIRVHLQSIGHPICGDRLYSKDSMEFPSLMLISKNINFICPVRKTEINLSSPISLNTMFSEFSR